MKSAKSASQRPDEHRQIEPKQPEFEQAQVSEPDGPTCEWPRWKGGDPNDRWPASQHWPLNR